MANSNTSLNGYEFGRSPRTRTPFWGESGEGAAIDDTGIYTDKTWSSKKISDELAEKADGDDVYTKAEVDNLISGIPAVDAYTKAQTDELLAGKAAVTSVYTKAQTYSKTEVDNLLSQIPAVDAYTKAQTDSLLDAKANAADVYTKSQVDNLIPDVSGLATKTELNNGLADCAKATAVYTKAQTYSKSEVDDLISGATPAPVDAYTKAQTDSLLAAKADKTELTDYAKVTSVYTKAQTYTKAEVDALIGGGGLDSDSLITFTDAHGLFRYTSNYGASNAFEVGSLYNISGTVQFKIDGITVYNGGLDEVPYNELATGATQNNISGSAKYLWKDWVVTYTSSDGTYVEIPVKITYIGSTAANNKYNPYIHIIYPSDCGHVITFDCLATDYIKVSSSTGFNNSIVKKFSILGENAQMSGGKIGSFYDDLNLYNVDIEDSSWNWAGTLTVTLTDETTVSAVISGSRAEGSLRYLPWNSLNANTGLPDLDVGGWKTIYIKGIPLRVCVCGYETYSDLNYPYIAIATETGTPVEDIEFTIPSGCHITLESNNGHPYIYRNNGLGAMENYILDCKSDINAIKPNRVRYDATNSKLQYWQTASYPNSWADVPDSGGSGGLQEYEYTIANPASTTISTAIMSALVDAITNVGIDNMEKLRKIVAKTSFVYGSTPHVKECIYDVKYINTSKGGGNFDDIDICAAGGENYYSAGDNIKTTKLIASRYMGILNTVEQSGANPVVTSTDWSSTNVGDQMSPWYHQSSGVSDLAYKLVFVYG